MTSLGRDTWKKLIGSEASLQLNCNKEGFNVKGGISYVRIGILGNGDQTECLSSDSRIGFGVKGHPDDSNVCGNVAKYGADNGNKFTKLQGYILIQ